MKHLGDITKISGGAVPPVNVIIGGSPCQDLSVAGKRAGLAGERSGLFMEQIRIIKEMRIEDENRGRTGTNIRPRYMVWENVPGAFSSNKGADFGVVLQETVRVGCKEAPAIPVPDKGWPTAGCLVDVEGNWSVAWRVFDAQFWGVPQRRRRIALVADFGGMSAPEVLFERKGVSWDSNASRTPGKETAGGIRESPVDAKRNCLTAWGCQSSRIYTPDGVMCTLPAMRDSGRNNQCVFCLAGNMVDRECAMNGSGVREDTSFTLNATDKHAISVHLTQHPVTAMDKTPCLSAGSSTHGQAVIGVAAFSAGQGAKAKGIGYSVEKAPSLKAANSGTNMVPVVYDARGNGNGKLVCTITGDHERCVTDYTALCIGNGQLNQIPISEQAGALNCVRDQQAVLCAALDCRNLTETEQSGTLQSKANGGYSLNYQNPIRTGDAVRRLTPLECERLQGFPDGWTDIGDWTDSKGKVHKASDAVRYKALGNSIAIPPWMYVSSKLSLCCGADSTMASLFDGIGGFPLIWEMLNGKGSCLWASEIEEFPIAVTKIHFPEGGNLNEES